MTRDFYKCMINECIFCLVCAFQLKECNSCSFLYFLLKARVKGWIRYHSDLCKMASGSNTSWKNVRQKSMKEYGGGPEWRRGIRQVWKSQMEGPCQGHYRMGEKREEEMERGAERQKSSYHQYPFSRGTYEQGLVGSCEVENSSVC